MKPTTGILLLFLFSAVLSSCGSNPDCSNIPITVAPASATANHAAAPPANQVRFSVSYSNVPSGCAIAAVVPQADWTVSDPTDVQISSAKDSTNGTATCLNATNGPVTITGSYQGQTGTAQLTCQ